MLSWRDEGQFWIYELQAERAADEDRGWTLAPTPVPTHCNGSIR
jgi:hypothetical protein